MSTNEHTTTFWQLLNQYKIEIPIIQRDYAQGRKGKESLRKNFLSDLKTALDNPTGKKMKLDFVYGSSENGSLYPLDGQQRLTTLWLLHWYIALRAHKLEEAFKTLKNFSYETRTSSRDFCESLCVSKNFEHYIGHDIVDFITNQTWFNSAWKHDPTVQSMLRMLGGSKDSNIADGIQKIFNCRNCFPPTHGRGYIFDKNYCVFKEYYNTLTDNNCPIVFYYLEKDFGNSDDLYIKMNARGEQLTSFENFKADLIGYISHQSEKDKSKGQKQWESLKNETTGIPIKMDTTWTEIFWNNKSKDYKIDEIYFAFLNRFFWNKLFIAKDEKGSYILDIGKGDENSTQENDNLSYRYLNNSGSGRDEYDTTISYKGLDVYRYFHKEIPYDLFSDLQIILDNYSKHLSQNNNLQDLLGCSWDNDFKFIPIYEQENKTKNNIEIRDTDGNKILKISHLNQVQRVVFFAICKYFKEVTSPNIDEISLGRWMRVVWNLVSGEDKQGPQIRSTSAMRKAIIFINNLNSHDVYQSLLSQIISDNSEFDERCKEEIEKANQILYGNPRSDGQKWEDIIKTVEKFEFFKGSIRFLFHDAKGNIDWTDFDIKWRYTSNFFKKGTVISAIELAKYCSDEQIKKIWSKFSFETSNWKFLLLQKSISEPIHKFLTGSNSFSISTLYVDIKNLLSVIKETNVGLMDWPNMKCQMALTNYKVRKTTPFNGWVFEVGNATRNHWNNIMWQIFSQNNSPIEIYPPEAWGKKQYHWLGQVYYRGLWTNFKYKYQGKVFFFTYYGNNTIYLMDDDWKMKKRRNKKLSDNDANNFCVAIGLYYDEEDLKRKIECRILDFLS